MDLDPAMLASLNPKPDDYFKSVIRGAKELMAAERRGGPIPAHIDFSVQPVCASCRNAIPETQKPLRCSACKAVLYCSKPVCSRKQV